MLYFFLMILRPPRSTQGRSSAASDVYKRQALEPGVLGDLLDRTLERAGDQAGTGGLVALELLAVSYTHLRAHETVLDLV